MAHARGVQVMADGAHTFAHIDFKIPDLGCDYYGTSLHKWLGVPLGAGLLFVRKDRIPAMWPIYGDNSNPADDDVMKLNHTGTHPVHTDMTIADAIDFHNTIGTERKEARLRYLTQYWTSKVRGVKNVVMNSPSDSRRTCGIANVGIRGMPPADMAKTLFDRYRIWTVAVDNNGVQGCRITPHVFILPRELDTFVKAISEMATAA
jgi:selenocysteine lyase/cysteine desulfurase